MRKNLYYAIVLLAFSTTAYKAQTQRGVGINTDQPAATLDVKATITDNTMPDAVLVPRMTLAQLVSKDNTSGTYGSNQNGALIYIIDDAAGSGTRRAKINGHGFYYFDSVVPEWKPFGGGAAPVATAMNVTAVQTASYTAAATDDIILLNINS